MHVDSPVMATIKKIVQETPNVRTFTFDYTLGSHPGQFVMLWVPGIDQKPFSIGNDTGKQFSLSIFKLGKSTQELFNKKVGDRLGITGPYGTHYTYAPKTHLITVGGGYGAAPLGYLAEKAIAEGCTVDFVVGARTAQDVLFEKRAKKAGATVHISTDDGSKGFHGYNTVVLEQLLLARKASKTLKNTTVYACGPEIMQLKIAQMCAAFKVPCQISLERYMKCGFGICGNCCVDDKGYTTCQQGPVCSGEAALSVVEFGKYHRDKTGIRHNF